jgi:hypothetical protein
MSPGTFWLRISALAVVEIVIVSPIIWAGMAEYGGEFIIFNVLLWGSPCALAILGMCISRFWSRNR